MGVSSAITMADAAAYAFRDGIKASPKTSSDYFDDGKTITTTFSYFCDAIDINIALFKNRQIKGLQRTFAAYSFHLVAGKSIDSEVLATVVPLSPLDEPTLTFDVKTRASTDMKLVLTAGEPVLLTRNHVPFAVMCPNEKYVFKKIAEDLSNSP